PEPAGLDRVFEQRAHRSDLVGARFAADGLVAHDLAPKRAVTDEEARIDADVAVERAEVLREARPLPRHALFEGSERHALDLRHHPTRVVGVTLVERCEREAAVAADDRRDAVQARRRRGRVPEELRVVVRVRIDEPGRDGQAVSVDHLVRRIVEVTEGDDASVAHPDVGPARRRAGAVDDVAAADDEVEHAHALRETQIETGSSFPRRCAEGKVRHGRGPTARYRRDDPPPDEVSRMRRSTARIALALVALTIADAIPAAADAGRDTAAAPLVIASFVPETGTLMPVLDSLRVPVELAVDEVNAAGGVNGQPVTLLRGDEGDTVATARATFAQLVAQHVDAIEGPAAPATTLGILGAVKKAHVLMCSGSDTLAPVTAHSSDGYFFRTAPPSRLEGYALAELTLSDGHRRVAVLRRDDFFGDELDATLVSRLQKGGAKIVSDIAYDATATDYAGDAAKVARGKPDAIVVLGFNDDGARIVQSLAAAGIGP